MTTTTTTARRRTEKCPGCKRRTERTEGWCLRCSKGKAPEAIHALTGGRWVRGPGGVYRYVDWGRRHA